MYLSKLVLNPKAQDVMADLSDPYQLHRSVMSGFPQQLPDGERVLFRQELQRTEPYIVLLVQSHTPPDWDNLAEQGYLLKPAAVKTFTPHTTEGQMLRFRLVANPTKRLRTGEEKNGPRIGLQKEEDQLAWLHRKGEQHGFQVLAATVVKLVQPDGWKKENGKNHRIRQQAVRFDGILQITETETFNFAWSQGIGSGKGMGFGLLTLAPTR